MLVAGVFARTIVTPDAVASFCTAVTADSSMPSALVPTGIFESTAYSFVPGCFGQLKPNPFGITISSLRL